MDIIFSASILAAFLAGVVALFAPCCITVLLPSYLASAFREKRNLLKMTFIFFAGIAVVLIPIGLGAAGLAKLFEHFHRELYIVGGAFMLFFGILAVAGKGFAVLPMPKRMESGMNVSHPKSVFVLGLFSGATTSCCAPVLVGAMTLAVLSGAFWKGLIVMFSYVFGMVLPLFLAAYFYDRFQIDQSRFIRGKVLEVRLPGKTLAVHSTNLIAGGMFFAIGAALVVLAFSGNAFWAPGYQVAVGDALNRWSQGVFDALNVVPDVVWGTAIVALFLFLAFRIRSRKRREGGSEHSSGERR